MLTIALSQTLNLILMPKKNVAPGTHVYAVLDKPLAILSTLS